MSLSRNRTNTTFWNLFFQGVAIVLSVIPGFLLVPLYLRLLSGPVYAAWLVTGDVLVMLSSLDPGVGQVVQQRIASAFGQGDDERTRRLLATTVLFSALAGITVLVFGLGATTVLEFMVGREAFVSSPGLTTAFVLAVVGSAFSVFSYGIAGANGGLQASIGTGLVSVAAAVLSLCCSVSLLIMGLSLPALGLGMLVRGLVLLVGQLGYLRWRTGSTIYRTAPDRQTLREVMRDTTYLWSGRIAAMSVGNLDALLVSRLISLDAVAPLMITRRPIDALRMIAERPTIAAMAPLAHLAGERGRDDFALVAARLTRLTVWATASSAAVILACNPELVRAWAGEEYFAGTAINVALALAFSVSVAATVTTNLEVARGGIRPASLSVIIQSATYVIAALFLIAKLGPAGAPLAGAVGAGACVWWLKKRRANREAAKKFSSSRATLREAMCAAPGVGAALLMGQLVPSDDLLQVGCRACVVVATVFASGLLLSKNLRQDIWNVWERVSAALIRKR